MANEKIDGEWLHDRMEEFQLKQRDIAELLDIDQSKVSKVLSGARKIQRSEESALEEWYARLVGKAGVKPAPPNRGAPEPTQHSARAAWFPGKEPLRVTHALSAVDPDTGELVFIFSDENEVAFGPYIIPTDVLEKMRLLDKGK